MWLDVAASLLEPVVDVLEGAAVGDVEQEEPAHGVTVVSPGDGPAEVTRDQMQFKTGQEETNRVNIKMML